MTAVNSHRAEGWPMVVISGSQQQKRAGQETNQALGLLDSSSRWRKSKGRMTECGATSECSEGISESKKKKLLQIF